jgi:hypothetical protein
MPSICLSTAPHDAAVLVLLLLCRSTMILLQIVVTCEYAA